MVILLSIILSFYHFITRIYKYSMRYYFLLFSFFCPIFFAYLIFFLYKNIFYGNIICVLMFVYTYYIFYVDKLNCISTKIQEKSEC